MEDLKLISKMAKRRKRRLSDAELARLSIGVPIGTGIAVIAGQQIATATGTNISPALTPLLPAAGLFGTIGLTSLAVRQLRRLKPKKKRRKR